MNEHSTRRDFLKLGLARARRAAGGGPGRGGVGARTSGRHAAGGIAGPHTGGDCWRRVEPPERTGRYCTMMENCGSDRREMLILNLVRRGVLGEVLHAECG